ncbi:MAG: chorismate-binding protein [Muribaculaceae bacterium]|nr:chorismate-binding protein [Muribaculaceae bacterium]
MGIRYDSSFRRATNGPVIFFSDSTSEALFAEEINGAIISGLSFYSYRLPGDMMITFGSSEGYVEGIGEPGFVIGRFDPEKPVITIPYKGCKSEKGGGSDYTMPLESTTREEYIREVEKYKEILKDYPRGKIVASRVMVRETSVDLAEIFFDFCKRFPEGYIFCFSTPATGCWIGASPELLLESSGGNLKTMALAGTRIACTTEPWDEKNIEEQRIVAEYIIETFRESGLEPSEGETFDKITGNIEHICTPIASPLPDRDFNLPELIKKLSPTPALCGSPKEIALHAIKETEKQSRGCYGGFCGPYHSSRDFTFNVVLRCLSADQRRYCLYAGGGITLKSDAETEWEETEAKFHNILPE